MAEVKIDNKFIGDGHPVFIIAEIGINHNGSIEIAKKLIDAAILAGCDAVKFQKRTPELAVPKDQWNKMRETPWGYISYIDYRHKVEFGHNEYQEIDDYCKQKGITWFASVWDVESVKFLEDYKPIMYKVPSAALTDKELLGVLKETKRPIMLSSGMSRLEQVDEAIEYMKDAPIMLAQATSTYPCALEELNLSVISFFKNRYPNIPIGYSGHEVGLAPTYAAVALGATFIERHFTLDRSMWGTDQAASVEVGGMFRLVKDIRDIEKSLGDGIKRVYDSEIPSMQKLRKVM